MHLKKDHRILLFGLLAVALLDTVGSIASRQLNFDYSLLSIVSFIIYGSVGFFIANERNLRTGALYGAILGLFDSTVGLSISILLEANTGEIKITPVIWIITVVFMIGVGALVGLIGGGLSRVIRRSS